MPAPGCTDRGHPAAGETLNQGADMTGNYRKDPEAVSRLTSEQHRVTQKNGTESPFRNEYWDNKEPGTAVRARAGGAAVRLGQQVRQPHRLAELHGPPRAGQRGPAPRLQAAA